jgi:hypothetical protein
VLQAEVVFDMVYGIMEESGSAEDLQEEGLKKRASRGN